MGRDDSNGWSAPVSGRSNVPEPRRKRRTSFGRLLFSLFATMAVFVALSAGLTVFAFQKFNSPGPLATEKTVAINKGTRSGDIVKLLEGEGVIANPSIFMVAVFLNKHRGGTLKAGEYEFEKQASMRDVFDMLRRGRTVTYKITVPEGFTTQQVLARLRGHEALTGEIEGEKPEGTLLPDTYVFSRGTDRTELLNRMRAAQQELVDRLWEGRSQDIPVSSKEEAIILASIVEKETGLAEERARVAAVFHNRLRKKMRLQSDPTIVYGIVGGKGRLGRPIYKSDISKKTAYNTYQIDGLPPTPIANPGREAIAAVLQPDETDELFFVADGTGGHVFARTYAEHRKNVQRWREIEAERQSAAAAAAGEPPEEQAGTVAATSPGDIGQAAAQTVTAGTQTPASTGAAAAPEVSASDGQDAGGAQNPQSTPAAPATQAAGTSLDTANPAPGSVVRVAGKLVPIPRRKPVR